MKREYVEIGGVKWATKNVGAEKETDVGLYFQNGEVQGYPHPTNLYQFNKMPKNFYDSVQTYWGDNWRMPTKENFYALLRNTTNEWIENYKDSGVNGRLFTDRTDSSKKLFFSACGFCLNGNVYDVGYYGYYWSSYIGSNIIGCAWSLLFGNRIIYVSGISRCYGYSVRGVLVDK